MSLPAWGAWIEIANEGKDAVPDGGSLPAWGAWIEIFFLRLTSPERMSLPAWGAWIEIDTLVSGIYVPFKSLPAWGAWIEILDSTKFDKAEARRSPRGGRGLK